MRAVKVQGSGHSRTRGELLSRLGRWVLWAAVALVLVRGLAGILDREPGRPAGVRAAVSASSWPDEAARAYAIEFASAYLSIAPEQGAGAGPHPAAELASMGIADVLAPTLDGEPAPQQVESATVVEAVRVDARHALITVSARVRAARPRTIRLTVPVARDTRGALVVSDLPALAPTPARAAAGPLTGAPILGDERQAIADVLTRFLRAYVSGDRAGLAYLVPAGTRIAASAGGFELGELGALAAIGPETGRVRLVLAIARVRDRVSRATYALRYRVRLVRRDRWYVAAINDPRNAGGSTP